jgi:hypothetical protein
MRSQPYLGRLVAGLPDNCVARRIEPERARQKMPKLARDAVQVLHNGGAGHQSAGEPLKPFEPCIKPPDGTAGAKSV